MARVVPIRETFETIDYAFQEGIICETTITNFPLNVDADDISDEILDHMTGGEWTFIRDARGLTVIINYHTTNARPFDNEPVDDRGPPQTITCLVEKMCWPVGENCVELYMHMVGGLVVGRPTKIVIIFT